MLIPRSWWVTQCIQCAFDLKLYSTRANHRAHEFLINIQNNDTPMIGTLTLMYIRETGKVVRSPTGYCINWDGNYPHQSQQIYCRSKSHGKCSTCGNDQKDIAIYDSQYTYSSTWSTYFNFVANAKQTNCLLRIRAQ